MSASDASSPHVVLDLMGRRCPDPLLGVKRMVDDLAEGETLLLISDCPGTRDDLFAWAEVTNNQIDASARRPDGGYGYTIRKGRPARPAAHAVLDVRGVVCPGPIVEAHHLLARMQPGEVLRLISDCPGVSADMTGWTASVGVELLSSAEIDPGAFEFYLRRG